MYTPTQLSRFAAYLDCEGSIVISKLLHPSRKNISPSFMLYLTVVNTDRRITDWCKTHFGGWTYVQGRSKSLITKQNHPIHVWRSSTDTVETLRQCMPYLVIKQEQALIALALRRTFKEGTQNKKLTDKVLAEREAIRNFMRDTKKNRRGNFVLEPPSEIAHLFEWFPEEIGTLGLYVH